LRKKTEKLTAVSVGAEGGDYRSHSVEAAFSVERGGSARSFHVDSTGIADIMPIVRVNVAREATHYNDVGREFAGHKTVKHSEEEYEGQDHILVRPIVPSRRRAARALPACLLAAFAIDRAEMGFVGFDDITIAAHGLLADNAHRFADTVRHEPSGLEGDAQTAVKLVARNALLAGAQKIHSLQPKSHRNVAVLKHGSDLHAERLAALVALINAWTGALALKLTDAIRAAAMRADRAVRPHAGFNPGLKRRALASMIDRRRRQSSSRRRSCRPISRAWARRFAPSMPPGPIGFMSM
jgi:hypothetical protein